MIKNWERITKNKINYRKGHVYCKLWDTDIDVLLFDDDVTEEYAERCAEAMNNMPDELVDAICRAAKKYCIEFLDEIGGASLNEIELTVPVDENTPPREIIKCITPNALSVETPEDPSRIGYVLDCNCDWEEEHGMEIDILDDRLVFLREFTGGSPWSDHSEDAWNYARDIYED